MNRKFLTMAAFAAMCVFATTSCSNDDDVLDNGNNIENVETAEVSGEITLALNGGGEGMETRAGRPVNSSAADNNVDKVVLKLVKVEGETYSEVTDGIIFADADGNDVTTGLNWKSNGSAAEGGSEGVPGDKEDGRDVKQKIRIKGLTGNGTYRIVAYGYEDAHKNTIGSFDKTNGYYTTTVAEDTDVEEFFAGQTEFEVADGKITTANVEVTLKRQVAGLLGYFKNIPIHKADASGTMQQVKKVVVKTVADYTSYYFPAKLPNDEQFNGLTGSEKETVLLTYDLATLVDSEESGDYEEQVEADKKDGTYKGGTFKIDAKEGKVATHENSILAGRFIVPFKQHVDKNTLVVALYGGESGNVLIREWNIKINDAGSEGVDATKYDIKRNKFYSIGKKLKSDVAPVDPNPDPDEPVDLNNDNDIIVIVNDAWDVVYDMGLED